MTSERSDEQKIVEIEALLNEPRPFRDKCDEIGDLIYHQYVAEENQSVKGGSEGCGDLMVEWIKSRFWSQVVRDHISAFNKVWGTLSDHGHTSEKLSYTYGDMDVSVWVERVKNQKDKKVIASRRHCSCADDNVYLFIMTGLLSDMLAKFLCRTVWPRQKRGGYRVAKSAKYPKGWFSWGDDRDIKVPSLVTYRERDFKFGYQDCRDQGHVFSYSSFPSPTLDHPTWHENRISPALSELRGHLYALSDYDNNKC